MTGTVVNVVHGKPLVKRRVRVGILALLLFGSSVALSVAGLGNILQVIFPVSAMALGSWLLIDDRREDYIALTLWLFLLTPGLRRLVDFQAGWSPVNGLMLAPYASGVLCVGPVLKMSMSRRFGYGGLFTVIFVCISYGFVVAVIDDRLYTAIFDLLRWDVPPCLCLLIALDPERRRSFQDTFASTMVLALILLSLYGTYQFVALPPWDAMWIREAAMVSVGQPESYLVHIFSTMNSPGSFSTYVMVGLLITMPTAGPMRMPAIGIGTIALLLTLVRSSWLGLLAGLIFLLFFGASVRARFNILIGLVCVPFIVLGLEQIPQGAEIIDSRLNTLSNVQNDQSYIDRSAGYRDFLYRGLLEAPFGSGLGVTGTYQSYIDHRAPIMVDGAIIEVGMTLGVFAGGAYMAAIVLIAVAACWASVRIDDTFVSSCGAIVAALTLNLMSGTMTVGEMGVLFWITAGFCLVAQPRTWLALDPRPNTANPFVSKHR